MLILLALTTCMTFLFSHRVPDILAILTMPIQTVCVDHTPVSPHRDLFAALVCGQRLPSSDLKFDFARTALLHLIVASGSHLALIESFVRFTFRHSRRLEWTIVFTLFGYSMVAGFCPPFLRVLLSWGLSRFNSHFKLGWTRLQMLTLAGFTTLLCCNRQEDLLSLALSWIAGLAVFLVSEKTREESEPKVLRHLSFHTLMYLLMIPALLPLAIPHPLSILWNLILGPLLTIVLFPLAAVSYFLPSAAVKFVDFIFDLVLQLVTEAAKVTPAAFSKLPLSLIWIWIYLFALLLGAHWLDARTRRLQLEAVE